ncbi:MAG UNVERIFIED_CONTAM: hypothetical protein LVQ98_02370 [Rickettsiaceae bacterium]|jgi:chromosomal replication initiator protein
MNDLVLSHDAEYYSKIWSSVRDDLLRHYGEATFTSWFSKMHLLEAKESLFVIAVPTNFMRDWIKSNYLQYCKTISAALY